MSCEKSDKRIDRKWTHEQYMKEKDQCIQGEFSILGGFTEDLYRLQQLLLTVKGENGNDTDLTEFAKLFIGLLKKTCKIQENISNKPPSPISEQTIFHMLSRPLNDFANSLVTTAMSLAGVNDKSMYNLTKVLHRVVESNTENIKEAILGTQLHQVYNAGGVPTKAPPDPTNPDKIEFLPEDVNILDFKSLKDGRTALETAECNKLKHHRFKLMVDIINMIKNPKQVGSDMTEIQILQKMIDQLDAKLTTLNEPEVATLNETDKDRIQNRIKDLEAAIRDLERQDENPSTGKFSGGRKKKTRKSKLSKRKRKRLSKRRWFLLFAWR